jgi:pilus assembly protein CpaE
MATAIDTVEGAGRADSPATRDRSRTHVLAFVTDDQSEQALRKGTEEFVAAGDLDLKRGSIQTAIKHLQKNRTPEVLIVDISGEPRPLTVLGDLSEVVEPTVRVLVIGDQDDVEFYRYLTRQLGAVEYLHKPILPDYVARHFGPVIGHKPRTSDTIHGGRVLAITGSRGGVGATTLAANLAWHLSVHLRHQTVLMDADLQRGTAAMLLGADTGPGLRVALQAPERIDELLIERSSLQVNDRLHVLAATEDMQETPSYVDGAAQRLVTALRRRYNYVVLDCSYSPLAFNRSLLDLAHQRVLVMHPTLASVRDTLRLLALPNGSAQSRRATVVLNRHNMPGALTRQQIEKMLGFPPEICVPDLSAVVEAAATLGTPAVAARGPFRNAIIELATSVGLASSRRGVEKAPAKPRRLFGLLR